MDDPFQAAFAPFSPRKKYLVGVSGGRDSMTLLAILTQLGFKNLIVCHLDHGLRGREARGDARLVARTARRLKLPLAAGRVDLRRQLAGRSTELAAREARHAFFRQCAREHKCRRLLLAHHADDQIETCLFNFLRGSGAAGLGGMKPVAKISGLEILRPLLGITRKEIDAYVRQHKVEYREDASNRDNAHTRNRIRKLLPAVEKVLPSFRRAVLRAAEISREEDAWMEAQVPPVADRLSCRELRAQHPALRRRTVLRWLRKHAVADAGFAETERVLSLLEPGKGPAKINLPGNLHARRRAGEIFLEPAAR